MTVYVWDNGEELSIDFLHLFMFLYITQVAYNFFLSDDICSEITLLY